MDLFKRSDQRTLSNAKFGYRRTLYTMRSVAWGLALGLPTIRAVVSYVGLFFNFTET